MAPLSHEEEPATDGSAGHLRGAARGSAGNLAGAVVASTINVLLVLLVARQVAPETAGSLFAAISVFLIAATLARLGTATGLVYWIARLRARGATTDVRRCLRTALVPVAVAGVVVGTALALLAEPLGRLVGGDDPSDAVRFLRGLAIFLPFAALTDALLAASQGFATMRATIVVEKLGRPLLQLILTVAVLAASASGLLAVAWAGPYAAAMLVAGLWLYELMRRERRRAGEPAGAPDAGVFGPRQFWRYTAPRSVSTLVQLALQRLDIVLVAALSGPREAAVYTVATRFVVVGQLGSQAVATTVQPRLAAILAVDDVGGAGRLYQVATGWLVLATWPLYFLVLAFPAEFLALFGSGHDDGQGIVTILALAMLVATACGMVDGVLNMAGKTVWTLANSASALVAMVVVDVVLIPRLGALGAAIGWAVAILVNNLVPLTQLRRAFGLHPFGPETLRAITVSLVVLSAAPVATWIGLSTGWRVGVAAVVAVAWVTLVMAMHRSLVLDVFADALRTRRRARPAQTEADASAGSSV